MKKIIISTLLLTITLAEIEQGLRCYDIYPVEGTNTFTEYDDDGQTYVAYARLVTVK